MRRWSWFRPWESAAPWYVYYGTAVGLAVLLAPLVLKLAG